MRGLTRIADVMILNLLFIAASLPGLTGTGREASVLMMYKVMPRAHWLGKR
jgi:hypothetical protein